MAGGGFPLFKIDGDDEALRRTVWVSFSTTNVRTLYTSTVAIVVVMYLRSVRATSMGSESGP